MPIAVDVFSGFLGAGKTKLIKKLISEGVYEKGLVIIENEFGEVAIDGAYLAETNVKIKEIYSGCICCSVAGDFKKVILEVMQSYPISRLIIEPSGVAKLSDVLKIFKEAELKERLRLDRIFTVVDSTRFELYRRNFNIFYQNQIEHANTIILSRTQQLSEYQLENVAKGIRTINGNAPLVTTPWDGLDGQTILTASEEGLKEELVRKVAQTRRGVRKVSASQSSGSASEIFESYGIERLKPFEENQLTYLLECLKKTEVYGEILRAKGILPVSKGKWLQFDYVPEEYEIRHSKPYYTGKLCVIGTRLNKKALEALFKE